MKHGRIAVAAFLLVGASGCATRGYVRDRMAELRGDMSGADARLQGQADQNGRLALSARSLADSVNGQLGSVRDLALGRSDFREASRSRVYFAFNRAEPDDEARSVLDGVVALMRQNPGYVADVYGFTDPSGSQAYNLQLARRRADAVERYLVERMPGQLSRCRSIGFGESVPASEAEAMGRKQERRQVLVLLLERVPPGERIEALTSR